MATIPYVKPQTVAESSAQNALIQQVNTNTNGLESASSALSTTNGTVSDLQSRIAALESEPSGGIPAGTYFGQWTDDNGGSGQLIDTPDNGEKVTLFTTPVGIPTGMTMNKGTVTIANAGLYLITASVQTITNNGTLIAMWLGQSSATSGAGAKLGPNSGFRCDVLSATALVRLPANSPISVYASNWQGTPPIGLWRSRGNVLTVSYLGP